jgi:hypothetical protein
MSSAGYVARIGEKNACRILVGKPEERLYVGGRIILKWILERLIWLRIDTSGGLL